MGDNFPVLLFLPSLVLMVVFVFSQCGTCPALPLQHTDIYFCWFGNKSLLQLSAALWLCGLGWDPSKNLTLASQGPQLSQHLRWAVWYMAITEEVGVPHSE